MRRNWLRPKVVLCLLSAPAFPSVGVYLSWLVTDGWQDWSWFNVLRIIFVVVVMFGLIPVGLIIAAIEYTKDKY